MSVLCQCVYGMHAYLVRWGAHVMPCVGHGASWFLQKTHARTCTCNPHTYTLTHTLLYTGWGMLVAALAMAYAGGVEVWRLKVLRESEDEGGSYTPNQAAPLSIFWQVGMLLDTCSIRRDCV
jgi:hypothetical protein